MPSLTSPTAREDLSPATPGASGEGDIGRVVHAWIESARGTLARNAPPLFSGVALPSPRQLMARRRTGDVDPTAAAALRHAVEGSVLNSGALDASFELGSSRKDARNGVHGAHEGATVAPMTPPHHRHNSVASALRQPASGDARQFVQRHSAGLPSTSAASPAAVSPPRRYNLRSTPARAASHHARVGDHDISSPFAPGSDVDANKSHRQQPAPNGTAHAAHVDECAAPQELQRGSDRCTDKAPLVFMHGVGFGVMPYLGFVRKLLHAFQGAHLLCYAHWRRMLRHVSCLLNGSMLDLESLRR